MTDTTTTAADPGTGAPSPDGAPRGVRGASPSSSTWRGPSRPQRLPSGGSRTSTSRTSSPWVRTSTTRGRSSCWRRPRVPEVPTPAPADRAEEEALEEDAGCSGRSWGGSARPGQGDRPLAPRARAGGHPLHADGASRQCRVPAARSVAHDLPRPTGRSWSGSPTEPTSRSSRSPPLLERMATISGVLEQS